RQDAYLKKGLVSSAENVTSMIVTLALPMDPIKRLPAVIEMVGYLNDVKAKLLADNPGMEAHFMGGPSLEASMVDVVKDDLGTLMPITVIVSFFTLGLLLRSGTSVMGTIFIIITANVFTMGVAGWMGYSLTPTSMMAPMMVLVLAMADSVHVLTQYIVAFRQGNTKEDAMKISLESNMVPIILTSVTTAIGFLGMNFSESPAFHDFGNITAMGVLFAFVYTVTYLPGIVLAFPMEPNEKPLKLTPMMESYARFVIKRQKPLLWGGAFMIPIVCAFIPQNELNDNIIEYFDDSMPLSEAVSFANEHLSGFQYILFSLDSKEEGGANEPEFLTKVDEFSEWIRAQNNVSHVFSYVDIMLNLNKAMHNDDDAFKTVPDSRELAAQYLLLYEMSLPAGNDLTRDVNADRSAVRLMISLNTMPNKELTALDRSAQKWWQDNAPQFAYTGGGSRSLMFANIGQIIVMDMIFGSSVALFFITLIILVGIRSIKYGVISLIPNILPAAIVYGAWGFLVGEVNQAAAMTFSISLGLVVDDTVHFLTKYIKARHAGKTSEESIYYSFSTAGAALLVTSAAIIAGQMVLMLSSFVPNQTMAIMLSSILGIALLLDFSILPPVLLLIDKKKEAKQAAKSSIQSQLSDDKDVDVDVDVVAKVVAEEGATSKV
ncbi:MAG: MMPL family transporter, partial [Gammaproteobacteria bacterium]|nr:MMPL family transporter [Gammaproteobacteria bacterium]